jgi:hypothetical protein
LLAFALLVRWDRRRPKPAPEWEQEQEPQEQEPATLQDFLERQGE